MVVIGEANGVRTSALITAMDTVLGRAAGNAIEVTESVEVLSGRTQGVEDLVEVTLALAEEMVALSGVGGDPGARLADVASRRRDAHRPGRRSDAPVPEANQRLSIQRSGLASSPGSMPSRSGRPPGGSAPDGPARKTR
jgi:thymidine phosphorylase